MKVEYVVWKAVNSKATLAIDEKLLSFDEYSFDEVYREAVALNGQGGGGSRERERVGVWGQESESEATYLVKGRMVITEQNNHTKWQVPN